MRTIVALISFALVIGIDLQVGVDAQANAENVTTSFTDIGANLLPLSGQWAAWGDYNNDGFLDVLIVGYDRTRQGSYTGIYANIGGTRFESLPTIELTADIYWRWQWDDYGNDGYLDMLYSYIYRRHAGTFSAARALPGPAAWADYDNDGYCDAFTFTYRGNTYVGLFYRQSKDGQLILDGITNVIASGNGDQAWGDYDNDGYADLLITGYTSVNNVAAPSCRVYHNLAGTNFVQTFALPGVYQGTAAWGDYDNDGFLDIVVGGQSAGVRVYRNIGGHDFAFRTSFANDFHSGSLAWGDYDGDGALDILLVGVGSNGRMSQIYRNLGSGNFALAMELPPTWGGAAWGDYDNDGDLDFILTGSTDNGGDSISTVFRNNSPVLNLPPSGPDGLSARVHGRSALLSWNPAVDDHTPNAGLTYNLVMGSGSNGVDRISPLSDLATGRRRVARMGAHFHNRSVPIHDLEPDVLYHWSVQAIDTSFAGGPFASGQVFKIPGISGPSDIVTNSPLGACSRVVAFTVSASTDASDTLSCRLDGNAISSPHNFPVGTNRVTCSVSNAWGDNTCTFAVIVQDPEVPGINCPLDIEISTPPGSNSVVVTYVPSTIDNCGRIVTACDPPSGSFFPPGTNRVVCRARDPAENTATCQFAVRVTEVPLFTPVSTELTGVSDGAAAWGDFDGDGRLDLLLSGITRNFLGRVTRLYRNSGMDGLTPVNLSFPELELGSVAWADIDLDGDLDVVLTGLSAAGPVTKLFRNDGDGHFADLNASLTGLYYSAVAWGDYDNDGRPDLLVTGTPDGINAMTRLYRNCDDGCFVDVQAQLPAVVAGAAAWADYDNDGTLDLFLAGFDGMGDIARVYRSLGAPSGGPPTFIDINAGLDGFESGAAAWGDYDNDGRLDLVLIGLASDGPVSTLYRNAGHDSFASVDSAMLPPLHHSSVAWGDYDNDGQLDLALAGNDGLLEGKRLTRIYRNHGNDTFTDARADLVAVDRGMVAWADYDRDGRLDLLVAGFTGTQRVSQLYRSNVARTNTPPSTPADLAVSLTSQGVTLAWERSSDEQTPPSGLTYNLRITGPTKRPFIVSPPAQLDGSRLIASLGNVGTRPRWSLGQLPLPTGTYHWAVQAIDGALVGLAFSTESAFYIQQPELTSFGLLENGSVALRFIGSNLTYHVQGTTNLSCVSPWQPLGPATLSEPGKYLFIDASAPTNKLRFYRLAFP